MSTRSNSRGKLSCSASAVVDLHGARAQPRDGPGEGLGPSGVALDGDDRAAVTHPGGHVGGLPTRRRAQVEDALPRLRVERRRDAHRGARLRLVGAGGEAAGGCGRRTGPSTTSPSSGSSAGATGGDGQGARERLGVGDERVDAQRELRGRGSSTRASRVPPRPRTAPTRGRTIQRGWEWWIAASAGVASPGSPGRSRAARRSTAFTRRWPPRLSPSDLASSTLSVTAAWSGTPSRNRSWKSPSRSAAATAGSSLWTGRASVGDVVVDRAEALDRAER